ncbi:mismatch-specific DNA-glycosylase [Chitinimonas naiadis]
MAQALVPRVSSGSDDDTMTQALPDVMSAGLSVVFCGINPGLRAAASGRHFAGSGNRFWRVLHLAGFTSEQLQPGNDTELLAYRCGLTTAVARPTSRADQLSRGEFLEAATALCEKVERYRPACIAFLGKAAYAAISGQPAVLWGRQAATLGGATVWVLPNPSGLNRSFSLHDLTEAYRALFLAMDWRS